MYKNNSGLIAKTKGSKFKKGLCLTEKSVLKNPLLFLYETVGSNKNKELRLLIIFMVLLMFNCQNNSLRHTVILDTVECEFHSKGSFIVKYFELYKDGKSLDSLNVSRENKNILISNLKSGDYQLTYSTIERINDKINFKLKDSSFKILKLCRNEYIRHKPTLPSYIMRLKEGESYSINISNFGSASFDYHEIIIEKKNSNFIMKILDKSIILDQNAIDVIENFEIELLNYNLSTSSCSNSKIFQIKYQNEIKKIEDNTCTWEGHKILIDKVLNKI